MTVDERLELGRTRVFKDGDQWCAVYSGFVNLQESPAGFGNTPEEARRALELEREKGLTHDPLQPLHQALALLRGLRAWQAARHGYAGQVHRARADLLHRRQHMPGPAHEGALRGMAQGRAPGRGRVMDAKMRRNREAKKEGA
jgi:hypothetical protein